MSQYTTGEMAKLCGVTVRTVQFYDQRGILLPGALSEGGRRLYSEEDLKRMKIICFLRETGLLLDTIGQLLQEEDPGSQRNKHTSGPSLSARRIGSIYRLTVTGGYEQFARMGTQFPEDLRTLFTYPEGNILCAFRRDESAPFLKTGPEPGIILTES